MKRTPEKWLQFAIDRDKPIRRNPLDRSAALRYHFSRDGLVAAFEEVRREALDDVANALQKRSDDILPLNRKELCMDTCHWEEAIACVLLIRDEGEI